MFVRQEFCRFGGDWVSPHGVAQAGWAYFHIVTRSECVIEEGDILLLPHGNAHILRPRISSDRLGTPIGTEFPNAILRKTSLGVDVTTELICGQLHFEEASENLLIAALPDVTTLHAGEEPLMDRFRAQCDVHYELRRHLANYPPVEGLLALLGQRATAKVVIAMLRDPSYAWTLDELAARAVVSRATLIRSFGRISGVAPLTLLTELRLALARR